MFVAKVQDRSSSISPRLVQVRGNSFGIFYHWLLSVLSTKYYRWGTRRYEQQGNKNMCVRWREHTACAPATTFFLHSIRFFFSFIFFSRILFSFFFFLSLFYCCFGQVQQRGDGSRDRIIPLFVFCFFSCNCTGHAQPRCTFLLSELCKVVALATGCETTRSDIYMYVDV